MRSCLSYGVDNHHGWCISQDYRDGLGAWKKYTPSGCFKMLRLGKPGHQDRRVWGYNWNFRRALERESDAKLGELRKRVKECEADKEMDNCDKIVEEVFKVYEELAQAGWVSTAPTQGDVDENHLGEQARKVADSHEQELRELNEQMTQLQKKVKE